MTNELEGHFLNLYALALSDSHFDERELAAILHIGEEKGISKARFEEILIHPTEVDISYPTDFLSKVHLLYDFSRVIWADGKVTESEERSFIKFCDRFGFEHGESTELFQWLLERAKQGMSSSELEVELRKLNEA